MAMEMVGRRRQVRWSEQMMVRWFIIGSVGDRAVADAAAHCALAPLLEKEAAAAWEPAAARGLDV